MYVKGVITEIFEKDIRKRVKVRNVSGHEEFHEVAGRQRCNN